MPPAAYYGPPPVPTGPGGQPLAGFGARLGAYLIDAVILGAVGGVIAIPAVFAMMAVLSDQFKDVETDPSTGRLVNGPDPFAIIGPLLGIELGILVIMMGASYLYHVELFPGHRGVTLGKRALGITVVRLDDPSAPITRGVATKRWLMQFLVGLFVPFFSWIDGLWQLWDKPYQQCLHDKVAETIVVRVNR